MVSIIPDKLPHMHRYEPPKEQPAAGTAPEQTASTVPSPAPAVTKEASKKQAAPAEKAIIEKPALEKAPTEALPHGMNAAPPAIGEEGGSSNGWRLMKGSILLANLPGAEKEKHVKQ